MISEETEPKLSELLRQGRILEENGHNNNAASYYAQAIKLAPNDIRAWLLLAQVISIPERKRQCYRKVLAIDSANLEALRWLQKTEPDPVQEQIYQVMLQQRIGEQDKDVNEATMEGNHPSSEPLSRKKRFLTSLTTKIRWLVLTGVSKVITYSSSTYLFLADLVHRAMQTAQHAYVVRLVCIIPLLLSWNTSLSEKSRALHSFWLLWELRSNLQRTNLDNSKQRAVNELANTIPDNLIHQLHRLGHVRRLQRAVPQQVNGRVNEDWQRLESIQDELSRKTQDAIIRFTHLVVGLAEIEAIRGNRSYQRVLGELREISEEINDIFDIWQHLDGLRQSKQSDEQQIDNGKTNVSKEEEDIKQRINLHPVNKSVSPQVNPIWSTDVNTNSRSYSGKEV